METELTPRDGQTKTSHPQRTLLNPMETKVETKTKAKTSQALDPKMDKELVVLPKLFPDLKLDTELKVKVVQAIHLVLLNKSRHKHQLSHR